MTGCAAMTNTTTPGASVGPMYSPAAFVESDRSEIVAFLRRAALGHLVTALPVPGQPVSGQAATTSIQASALPFVIDDDLTRVRAHFAKANDQWRTIEGVTALLIVPGHDTYVSPRWYPSKAEHGRVVPTWNYELVHLHGTIELHDDAAWKRTMVEDLTDLHEARLSGVDGQPAWQVGDAPDTFIDGQLKAIVGVELTVTTVEAKRKLSQNRSEADRLGAAAALARSADSADRRMGASMGSPATGSDATGSDLT